MDYCLYICTINNVIFREMSTIQSERIVTDTVINEETGEVISSNSVHSVNVFKTTKSVDEFIFTFLEDLSAFYRLDNKTDIRLLAELWKMFPLLKKGEAESQMAILRSHKLALAEKIGVTLNTIDKTISKLVDRGLLFRRGRSIYALNAQFFFKGHLNDRLKTIKFQLNYDIENIEEYTL